MDLAIIFISLLLLMFFAYRGFSLIFIAPIFAVLAAITSDYTSMPVYSELYMTKAAEYIKSYYPVFLLGAVFAKIMEEGGLAASVAAKIVSVLGKERGQSCLIRFVCGRKNIISRLPENACYVSYGKHSHQ